MSNKLGIIVRKPAGAKIATFTMIKEGEAVGELEAHLTGGRGFRENDINRIVEWITGRPEPFEEWMSVVLLNKLRDEDGTT